MDRPTLYAQFDGDEIDGTRYALGDPIADSVDANTRAYLVDLGRLASVRPDMAVVPVSSDKKVEDMSRAELESEALKHIADEMREGADEDDLRRMVERGRERAADISAEDGASDGDAAKPLGTMKTAELEKVAADEGVTFDPETVKTNADRVKAIEAARTAKA